MIDEFSALIEQRTGLSAATRFRADLQDILSELAGDDMPGFYRTLRQSQPTAPAWQAVVRALTIGETYFFRDMDTFRLLREKVLPPIIQQRRAAKQLELTIWCAGCATGEEPYSVAITLLETLPDLYRWKINLIGTDINAAALEQARAGVYRDWAFRHCPADFRPRYFDAAADGWRIKPYLREMVRFQQDSLLDQPSVQPCDLIFCRNVLIYLTRPHAAAVETKLHDALRSDGWLLLGPAEAVRTHRERWITHIFPGAIFYQKATQPQTAPVTRRYRTGHPPEIAPATNGKAATDLYSAAVHAVHDGQPYEAERLLAELLTVQPNHAPAHTLLAYIFANRNAGPEAHVHLDTALRIDSMFSDAHYLRAALHLEAGQRASAEKALRAALYCRRDHPLATFLMGNLLAQAGDLSRANRAWSTAHALVSALPPDARISDLSDMTAAGFSTLIQAQLDNGTENE
ncbi:MAG TPA: CheR family methyltransferase [Spirillospora sp.]|nr:CheR family methyltransferase [Spirillospora sp.]